MKGRGGNCGLGFLSASRGRGREGGYHIILSYLVLEVGRGSGLPLVGW